MDGKPYQCGECGKRLKHKHVNKRHILYHCRKVVVVNEMESTASYVVAGRELCLDYKFLSAVFIVEQQVSGVAWV